jgi:hypothetical protein
VLVHSVVNILEFLLVIHCGVLKASFRAVNLTSNLCDGFPDRRNGTSECHLNNVLCCCKITVDIESLLQN